MTPRPATLARRLTDWFRVSARDLPWRAPASATRRDPYAVLVSELMLQQTQVARVVEKYNEFMHRFPSVGALADASEHDVLAAWTGLGYYRRARLLHAAARAVRDEHDGVIPREIAELRALPGVGPYTAGAIASIAFDQSEPLVDGNVQRVLLRLHGRALPLASREADAFAWEHARTLVGSTDTPGDLNEALMELGATVCTPRAPACESCPLKPSCIARRDELTDRIPLPKKPAARAAIDCTTLVLRDREGRVLMHRRPDRGLWAGMWQLPTIEASRNAAQPDDQLRDMRDHTAGELLASLGLDANTRGLTPLMTFDFATTHRDLSFHVVEHADPLPPARARSLSAVRFTASAFPEGAIALWAHPRDALALPLSSPMTRILKALAADPPALFARTPTRASARA
ncbi:MAG: A/G-specific adenine glycosylase [Phycisphaerales bacterium]|jgi:A/G-specific adenine glycosylase|nr:A/G-specific adenine glycosylase [Phycisphaerales bacterium]